MTARVIKKFQQVRRWSRSVAAWNDVPAAILLWLCRNHPMGGADLLNRSLDLLRRPVWIHPRSLMGYGLKLDLRLFDDLIIYEECFIENVYNLTMVPFQPDFTVDCGGYGGYFSLLAKSRFPSSKGIAFEPNPQNFRAMLTNFELNGVPVDAQCAAVSVYDGETLFHGEGCGGRIGPPQNNQPGGVRVINLLRILGDLCPRALLLKMDIEGEERNILPALIPRLPPVCAVFFEWHHQEEAFEEIRALFATHGFVTRRLRVRNAHDDCVYLDAFALRP